MAFHVYHRDQIAHFAYEHTWAPEGVVSSERDHIKIAADRGILINRSVEYKKDGLPCSEKEYALAEKESNKKYFSIWSYHYDPETRTAKDIQTTHIRLLAPSTNDFFKELRTLWSRISF